MLEWGGWSVVKAGGVSCSSREERMLWDFWDKACLDPCQNLCSWLVPAHLWRGV